MFPEHCPNPECQNFNDPEESSWFRSYGTYETAAYGVIPRYKCRRCGRTFSRQTFSLDYYVKKPVDYTPIMNALKTASGNRDIARELHVRNELVQNRIERLSRWAQGIHNTLLPLIPFYEDLVADGFETFSESQYYPCHINLFCGRDSQFIYGSGLSFLRRKGRMTPAQEEKKLELEKKGIADPGDIRRSMKAVATHLSKLIRDKGIDLIEIWTDKHQSYPGAFRNLPVFHHNRISSKRARTFDNPLFSVNYCDRQSRKDLSDHVRETVQFARHPSCMMCRFAVYRHHHNLLKPFRIKPHNENSLEPYWTHAEAAGIPGSVIKALIEKMEGKRFFLHKLDMDGEERKTWLQEWTNPGVVSGRYVPKHIRD